MTQDEAGATGGGGEEGAAPRRPVRTEFPPAGSAEPYAGFQGTVGRTIAESESWWPPRPEPREDAPDVITILCDDIGFSDLGCFGSEIATPNLDRLAAEGLRFANFHVTPMCSPSRATFLTGLQSHAAGVAHVCHADPGFPGYGMELAPDAVTLPELLREQGYHNLMVGKWHLAKDSDLSDAGPRHSWPLSRGYDRFYGILDGFTNFHQPHRLVEDNHTVEVDRYPDDYYLTDDLTDRAIAMIRSARAANPDQRFHLYLAHGAAHAPLHAKPDTIARYVEVYRVGWDEIRARRHLRAQELGVVPEGVALPPRNSEPGYEAPPWDELPVEHQELFARYMAVYAAMIEHVDESLGALRAALEQLGTWDDTLLVFTADNGASREGGTTGTTSYYTHLTAEPAIEKDLARIDLIGGPQVMAHYPQGWAMACNTPYRLYKTTTHAGGRQVPCIVSWPRRVADPGAIRFQYGHLSDMLPTVLDVLDLEPPTERNGQPVKQPQGISLLPVIDDPETPSAHTEQLFELAGNRGYYRDGWEIVSLHQPLAPFTDDEWELYDLRSDPTETVDLAAQHPEKVAELSAAWEQAAWDNQVFPLDEGSGLKYLIRPERNEVFQRPVTIPAGTPTLERWRSLQLVLLRTCTIRVSLEHRAGARGVLVSHGDQGGGYLLYVDDDELRFVHNDGHGTLQRLAGPLAAGTREVVLALRAVGGGIWDVSLSADDETIAEGVSAKALFPMAPFQGIDVGIARRSPVDWQLWRQEGCFPYGGVLHEVRYEPGPPADDSPMNFTDMLRQIALTYD
jgi:arylsulfatase A-like enzyme